MLEDEIEDEGDEKKVRKLHKSNPIIRYLQRLFITRKKMYKSLEIESNYYEPALIPVREDFRGFVKVFLNEETRDKYKELPKSASTLLYYIFENININSDEIYLHRSVVLRKTGMVIDTYNKARKHLIENEWIFESEIQNMYFINLSRFCKGRAEDIVQKVDEEEIRKEMLLERKGYDENKEERNKRAKEHLDNLKPEDHGRRD